MLSKIPSCALAAALTLLAACGSSSSVGNADPAASAQALGTAPVATPSTCELAPYPSVQWTLCEAQNVLVSQENEIPDAAILPQFLAATGAYEAMRLQTILADPARQPNPNLATVGCPVDPRINNWAKGGDLVSTVLYTSRSGGTISGHIWATKSGPAKRPGVLIINGSIFACEQVYWFAAQALAKAGFLVMSFDPQGEGMSDQFGEKPDQLEDAFAGTPILGLLGPTPPTGPGLGGNGLPFYDGGEDALDFFLSTPTNPYVPVPSRTTNTSHNPKQQSRVAAKLDNAYNPYWQMLDASSIGLAGHSYGAVASSWLAQQDSRVTTAVAWDALCVPTWPSPDELVALTSAPINQLAGAPLYGLPTECFGAPGPTAPPITKPALSINPDYLLVPAPYLTPPGAQGKEQSSLTYTAAGVDSGDLVIRGGTHLDFDDVTVGALPMSLRGPDLITWYTVAWFEKYLQHDPNADNKLLTARWRTDPVAATVDPAKDPNLYSWHYKSRLDLTLANGQHYACENLRDGCPGQTTPAQDCGGPATYAYVTVDTTPDAATTSSCPQ